MKRFACTTWALVAGCALLATGCDDEVAGTPDAAVTGDGGGGAKDGGAADAASDASGLTAQQERGRYLVDNVIACSDCHTPRDPMGVPIKEKYMAGAMCFIKLPNGDCLHSRNLTNDATGLKNRTDQEIKKMFQDGIRPPATAGGMETALNPVMPYYVFHNMDAADADAIVAYLRTIKPVENMLPARGATFDVPQHANYIDPMTIPAPSATYADKDAAMRGQYLAAKSGVCIECHTEHNPPGPGGDVLMAGKFFQGGERFDFGFPVVPVSKNLTPDPMTGLGNWSIQEIVRVLKEGKDKDGKGICPPMPAGPMAAYGGLTDKDATDIAHYLKSLAPATHMIVDMCTFPFGPPPMGDGGAPPDGGGAAPDAPGTGG